MTTQVEARIRWLSAQEGGRKDLPKGVHYSTVARFLKDSAEWSVVTDFNEPPLLERETIALMRFLSPEAPLSLLQLGSRFELLEGSRVVAKGEVIRE